MRDGWLRKGFTITELVITIIVAGIIAAVVVPKITVDDFKKDAQLTEMIAQLRYAQHKSMAEGGGWSVDFTATQYTVRDAAGNIAKLPMSDNPVEFDFNITASVSQVYFDYLGRPDSDNNSGNNNLIPNDITVNAGGTTVVISAYAGGIYVQ